MKYVYPAIFTSEDGYTLVRVPDLPGLHTFGSDVADALYMAQDAISTWLWDAENKHELIPQATSQEALTKRLEQPEQFVNRIAADTDEYRWQNDTRTVKKTVAIPARLKHQAELANAPFSQILQEGDSRSI
ncbi:MAG: type II toxin-antitoxin system HicB family antitoxin [Treponema sp.]|jgi:predicted RNase H-like HicB family nuclease|nr:type II toxin-antitoxin system HicB family antitoxin [Treponema sp.]